MDSITSTGGMCRLFHNGPINTQVMDFIFATLILLCFFFF